MRGQMLFILFGTGLVLVAFLAGGAVLKDARTMYIPLDSGAVLHVTVGHYQAAIEYAPGSHGVMIYNDGSMLFEAWLDNRAW